MAKKSSWRNKAEKAKEEVAGNASFFWSAEIDEWHDIIVDPTTIDVRPEVDNGEEHKWKKRMYVEIAYDDNDEREEEVPFWCQDDFLDELLSSPEDSGTVAMKYKRTKKGKVNYGKFRLSEDA